MIQCSQCSDSVQGIVTGALTHKYIGHCTNQSPPAARPLHDLMERLGLVDPARQGTVRRHVDYRQITNKSMHPARPPSGRLPGRSRRLLQCLHAKRCSLHSSRPSYPPDQLVGGSHTCPSVASRVTDSKVKVKVPGIQPDSFSGPQRQ